MPDDCERVGGNGNFYGCVFHLFIYFLPFLVNCYDENRECTVISCAFAYFTLVCIFPINFFFFKSQKINLVKIK